MYRALYDYSSRESDVLHVKAGDRFIFIKEHDSSWWKMQAEDGHVGFVPANYLTPDEQEMENPDTRKAILESIERAMEVIHAQAASNGGRYTNEQRSNLRKLIAHRKMVLSQVKLVSSESKQKTYSHRLRAHEETDPSSCPEQQKFMHSVPVQEKTYPSSVPAQQETDPIMHSIPTQTDTNPSMHSFPTQTDTNPSMHSFPTQTDTNPSMYSFPTQTDTNPSMHSFPTQTGTTPSMHSFPTQTDTTPSMYSFPTQTDTNPSMYSFPTQTDTTPSMYSFPTQTDTNPSMHSFPTQTDTNPSMHSFPTQTDTNPSMHSFQTQTETNPSSFPAQPRRSAPSLPSNVTKHSSKKRAPPVPSLSKEDTSASSYPLKCSECSSAMKSESQQDIFIPPKFTTELLEKLRINSGISYATSFVVADTILTHIKTKIPSIAGHMDNLLREIMNEKECGVHTDESLILSHDGQCIEQAFLTLTEHKDDAQQRSWALHMDEPEILEQLEELLRLLGDANQQVSKAVVQQNDFEYLHSTVAYFQMEHRVSIRLQLLQLFGCLCGVDKEVITQLLCSILPGELARTMQDTPQDLQLQLYSSLVLTMIFSTAEPLPHWLYDQLDKEFVSYLISCVEDAPDGEDGDQLIDSFVGLLLAFNQHFSDLNQNLVMDVLATCRTKNVSEKIMLLINREEDPVVIFDYPRSCSNSVLKFLMDVFASKDTSGLFFTSDMMVLLEIVLRQIADLNPGNQLRTQYLSLLQLVFTNTHYFEHKHLFSEIKLCLKRIEKEEDEPESAQDCQLVKKIFTQFSSYFS